MGGKLALPLQDKNPCLDSERPWEARQSGETLDSQDRLANKEDADGAGERESQKPYAKQLRGVRPPALHEKDIKTMRTENTRCMTCTNAHNGINGRYCKALACYVEYDQSARCGGDRYE